MTIVQANEAIGSIVMVQAEFWGTYTGILLYTWKNLHSSEEKYFWKAKIKIIDCIKYPSQLTIDGLRKCSRKPYIKGQEIDFNLFEIL